MKQNFNRNYDHLESIFNFTADFTAKNNLDISTKFAIDLAIEEIFTNMIKYNPKSDQNISIELAVTERSVIICLIDPDSDLFDITKTPEVDTQQPLENRKPGGLGIHFIKKTMDDVKYEYENRQSKITLIKKI